MPAPLPPLLDGPITTANKQVYVDNLLPNATVAVFANGIQVGTATTVNPGAIPVPLTATLHQGQEVTAKQTYNGTNPNISATGASAPSNSIKVQNPPNPLPAPAFASGLTTCADTVFLGNLIPGAAVHVTQGGNTLVNGVAVTQTNQSFPLAGTLTSGTGLQAWQTIGSDTSPKTGSLSVSTWTGSLPVPVVAEPLLACQTAIFLSSLIPSANLVISNGVTKTFAAIPWNTFELYGMTPLVAGTLTVSQSFNGRRCDHAPSPTAPFPVSSDAPPFPKVSYQPCGDIKQLFISNLVPGSVLTIKRVVADTSNTNTITVVGCMGVSQPTATVNLPASFSATAPSGPVSLWIEVLLCNRNLPAPGYTKVTFAADNGPYGKPVLKTPLYDCAGIVVVSNVHPGSQLQVFSGSTPLCNPVIATTPEVVIQLWAPLVTNQSVHIQESGCNSSGNSANETVQSFGKLGQPVIATPVRPGDATVQVSNVLLGALVTLLVNGVARSQATATGTTVSLPAGLPALSDPDFTPTDGDQLVAVQSLCTQTSPPGAATVALGDIKVSGVPGSMIQDKAVQLLIGATDKQTGAVLLDLPVVVARAFNAVNAPEGPSSSGFTGSSFDYTPGKSDTTAYVLVTNHPGYADTIVGPVIVTPPPPPPPSAWFSRGKVYGKNFPCTLCTVTGTSSWGDVPTGPWTGDITTGIAIPQTPCDTNLGGAGGGQSFGIQVACASDPAVSVSITVNC